MDSTDAEVENLTSRTPQPQIPAMNVAEMHNLANVVKQLMGLYEQQRTVSPAPPSCC
jgi:hypothetical protein